MPTSVSRIRKPSAEDHLVIFASDKNKFDKSYFNENDLRYLAAAFENGSKQVIVNKHPRIIIVQLADRKAGDRNKKLEAMRKAGDTAVSVFNKAKAASCTVISDDFPAEALAFAEGCCLGNYQFLKYRSEAVKEKNSVESIYLVSKKITDRQVQHLNIGCQAVYKARDLVNEPQNMLTASQLAQAFQQMGKEAGFKTTVFNKSKIESLKMGGLLAVNKGSLEPPTFTIMEYKPTRAKNKKPIVLVGKGVVYDTGGLSLKPTLNSMDYMKCDMAGAAVVGAALFAAAKARLPVHLIGLVPATDNRPDGNAYAPGDVITMMSGTTVEVLNTDAEGRMILADALHYAKRFQPQVVLEFSTLTGAAAIAIGRYGMVGMGNIPSREKNKLLASASKVYERIAEFPFWDEYDELIKSDIADIKNVGGPDAGAITAGKFLSRFTDYPFMHFDIAGPAFVKSNDSYRGKNASGFGVRFLFDFLENF